MCSIVLTQWIHISVLVSVLVRYCSQTVFWFWNLLVVLLLWAYRRDTQRVLLLLQRAVLVCWSCWYPLGQTWRRNAMWSCLIVWSVLLIQAYTAFTHIVKPSTQTLHDFHCQSSRTLHSNRSNFPSANWFRSCTLNTAADCVAFNFTMLGTKLTQSEQKHCTCCIAFMCVCVHFTQGRIGLQRPLPIS